MFRGDENELSTLGYSSGCFSFYIILNWSVKRFFAVKWNNLRLGSGGGDIIFLIKQKTYDPRMVNWLLLLFVLLWTYLEKLTSSSSLMVMQLYSRLLIEILLAWLRVNKLLGLLLTAKLRLKIGTMYISLVTGSVEKNASFPPLRDSGWNVQNFPSG